MRRRVECAHFGLKSIVTVPHIYSYQVDSQYSSYRTRVRNPGRQSKVSESVKNGETVIRILDPIPYLGKSEIEQINILVNPRSRDGLGNDGDAALQHVSQQDLQDF